MLTIRTNLTWLLLEPDELVLLTAIIVAAELNEIGIVISFVVDVVVDKIPPPWLLTKTYIAETSDITCGGRIVCGDLRSFECY